MYMLHSVRPDLIMLRVTARNLIMWDHVQPTEDWFLEQLPELNKSAQVPLLRACDALRLHLSVGGR